MIEPKDHAAELERIRALIESQDQLLAQLKAKEAAALASLQGAGVIVQGAGAKGVAEGGTLIEGDVHGPVTIHQAKPADTSPATLRNAYLSRLFEEVGNLSLAGIDPAAANDAEARLSLDAVYTALRTHSAEEVQERIRFEPGEPRLASALEQLDGHKRLVLLGDPGSGKSTFVSFVALCLAGEALGKSGANLALLRQPVPEEAQPGRREKKPEAQPWSHGALLPVRVVLRDFAARGLPPAEERACAKHLWAFLESTLGEARLAAFAPVLEKELLERGGLLLFDGLDEVPEADSCRERLCRAVEDFASTFGKCRVLVTCRTYAYRGQGWMLQGFGEAELAPFSDGQIRCFVERWYDHVAAVGRLASDEARGRAELLKNAIFGSQRLKGLAERPLLLTLMASLHSWRGGSLPERREQLYADAVDLLLNLWATRPVVRDARGKTLLMPTSLGQYLEVDREKVRQVIEGLAFEVHANGELEGTADIPEGELLTRLLRLGRGPEVNPAELVTFLSLRAGLLVPRGVGVYTFPHRTFQEYLAACHLNDDDFPVPVARLGRADPGRWREVVLLAGAKARGTRSNIWAMAEHLCPHDVPGREGSAEDVWGAHLAGQFLVESADLEQVSEVHQPKLERIRTWHMQLLRSSVLPATERALAGRTLATLGDPRFDPNRWFLPKDDLLGFVEIPAGPFLMGSETEEYSFGPETPKHEVELPTYYIGRFPVTVAQFGAFVASARYDAHPASREGLANEPVRNVSWHDTVAYCSWLEKRLKELGDPRFGGVVTLPSEAEWEKAARGTDGRVYPWEGEADPEKASYGDTGLGGPSAVGCFPLGASPHGCEEMSGNVWEWTRSIDDKYPYPKPGKDRARLEDPKASGRRVLRGGAFGSRSGRVRCAVRSRNDPTNRNRGFGFRVVLLPSPLDSEALSSDALDGGVPRGACPPRVVARVPGRPYGTLPNTALRKPTGVGVPHVIHPAGESCLELPAGAPPWHSAVAENCCRPCRGL